MDGEPLMNDDRGALERLDVAAIFYANAIEDRNLAMADLKQAIRECFEAGVPKLQIAQLAGVSRQTVYDTLQEGLCTMSGHKGQWTIADLQHGISCSCGWRSYAAWDRGAALREYGTHLDDEAGQEP
jgi:hypothetical protein